jgi:chaperonin cofactor prefoldin
MCYKQAAAAVASPCHLCWRTFPCFSANLQTPQKLLDNLDDASAELMLADDDEPVRMRVGECFWGVDKAAAEEKLETLTEEAQQHYRQLEQQMAGGHSTVQ